LVAAEEPALVNDGRRCFTLSERKPALRTSLVVDQHGSVL